MDADLGRRPRVLRLFPHPPGADNCPKSHNNTARRRCQTYLKFPNGRITCGSWRLSQQPGAFHTRWSRTAHYASAGPKFPR